MERRWAGNSVARVVGSVSGAQGALHAFGTSGRRRVRADDGHGRMVRSGWATRAAFSVGVAMGYVADRFPGHRRKWV